MSHTIDNGCVYKGKKLLFPLYGDFANYEFKEFQIKDLTSFALIYKKYIKAKKYVYNETIYEDKDSLAKLDIEKLHFNKSLSDNELIESLTSVKSICVNEGSGCSDEGITPYPANVSRIHIVPMFGYKEKFLTIYVRSPNMTIELTNIFMSNLLGGGTLHFDTSKIELKNVKILVKSSIYNYAIISMVSSALNKIENPPQIKVSIC